MGIVIIDRQRETSYFDCHKVSYTILRLTENYFLKISWAETYYIEFLTISIFHLNKSFDSFTLFILEIIA